MSREDEYHELFSGRLFGILQWDGFSRIWQYLAENPEGWYVRDFKASALPASPMPAAEFARWLKDTESFLRRRHREEYCGFLYVDDQESPRFLKIFDPRKMGSSCGCSGGIDPRWTVSRMPPRPHPDVERADAGHRRGAGILGRLFGRQERVLVNGIGLV